MSNIDTLYKYSDLKKEERKIKNYEAVKKFREDVKKINHHIPRTRLPDTDKRIEKRELDKKYFQENKDKVLEVQKKYREKMKKESISRIAEALAQEEATRKNIESMYEDEE